MNSEDLPPLLRSVYTHVSDPAKPEHEPICRELNAVADAIRYLKSQDLNSPGLLSIRDLPETITGHSDSICKCCGQEIKPTA